MPHAPERSCEQREQAESMSRSWRTSGPAREPVLGRTRLPAQLAGARASYRPSGAALAIGALGGTVALVINLACQVPSAPLAVDFLKAEASSPPVVGPQSSIACPVGAVNLPPGT